MSFVANPFQVHEADARVDDLRDVLPARDVDRRQPVGEMCVRAQRARLHRAEPPGGGEIEQIVG